MLCTSLCAVKAQHKTVYCVDLLKRHQTHLCRGWNTFEPTVLIARQYKGFCKCVANLCRSTNSCAKVHLCIFAYFFTVSSDACL